jgi:hypothetical protein
MIRIEVVDPISFMGDFPSDSERLSALKKAGAKFPTWETIVLGSEKEPEIFSRGNKGDKRWVNPIAANIMRKPAFTLAQPGTRLELVKVRLYDLCLGGVLLPEIFDQAAELGLKPCPAEVGSELWRQYYSGQLNDYYRLRVAMEPIVGSNGNPYIFAVECDEYGRRFEAEYALPAYGWVLDDNFIFCK